MLASRRATTQVGAGASLGPEGPLVHLGAMAGSFLTGGVRLRQTTPSFFRTDVDRRDFLSLGSACGFAAAFGAPVGGVLFALEEASSFWDDRKTISISFILQFFLILSCCNNIIK